MRKRLAEKLEDGRLRHGDYASTRGDLHGAFLIQGPCGCELAILSSGEDHEYEWEHVSVSTTRRTPNWQEMCFIKSLFWEDEDCVVEFHPPKSQYVNMHPHCLHLWKPIGKDILVPPPLLVGPKG